MWPEIASMGISALGSLLGGGQEDNRTQDERYYSGQNMRWDAWLKGLEHAFQKQTMGDRVSQYRTQGAIADWQRQLMGQQFGQNQERFGQRRQMFDYSKNLLGKPIFDAGANMGLLNTAMQPYQRQMMGSLASRGLSGGGMAGALGNLQTQQMAMPMWQALQQNAYGSSNRDMNIMGLFS